jgi:2'-5' RNA ligase
VRLFLAINLPDDVRRAIHEATSPLRAALPEAAWADPARLHVTLKFLGELPADAAPPLAAAVERVAGRHAPLVLRLGGVGAFPDLRRPRVVWLGVTTPPALSALHRDLERECAALGYEAEQRPFRAHVTLGRVRTVGGALARAAADVHYQAEVAVTTIELMESRLSSAGARYGVVASGLLRSA